jgi:hypothetical protein
MVAQLVKTIKPKALNIPAVKQQIERVLQAEGDAIAAEYRKTVSTWTDKPDFGVLTDTKGGDLIVLVGPTGSEAAVNHFVWTDKGTKPHIIQAKDGGRLFFGTTGGRPKTTPGIIGSNPGVIAGSPYTRPPSVNHPGTKARRFTAKIMSQTRRRRIVQRLVAAAKVEAK